MKLMKNLVKYIHPLRVSRALIYGYDVHQHARDNSAKYRYNVYFHAEFHY